MTAAYMLELKQEELIGLWFLLNMLKATDQLQRTESPILEKLQRLTEGR